MRLKISKTAKNAIAKRVKSLLWRTGMMFLAGSVDLILASLGDLNLPNGVTIILGLALGEVSKALNNHLSK